MSLQRDASPAYMLLLIENALMSLFLTVDPGKRKIEAQKILLEVTSDQTDPKTLFDL